MWPPRSSLRCFVRISRSRVRLIPVILTSGLWATGWHEARILAVFVEEPERVTSAQMDRWCRDFDNRAICDTVCFHLFDRTPHAFRKVA